MSQAGGLSSGGGGSSGITTINGDTGSVTGSTVTFNAGSQAGASVSFNGSGTTMSFNVTDIDDNTVIGKNAGSAITGASYNTGLGFNAFHALTIGSQNVSIGYNSSHLLTQGGNNTAVGYLAFGSLLTGNYNTAVGFQAGDSYTTNESSNIVIGNIGVTGENNIIHIGTQGTGQQQQNVCYIAGITGATYSAGSPTPALTYLDTSTGQLVSSQAVASSTATSAFGSLSVSAARQNTANYSILVNVSVVVSSATTATIILGVGSTNTPSTNTVVASFSTASALTFSFSAIVPAGYYMLVNTTGTIVVGSITTQTCALG